MNIFNKILISSVMAVSMTATSFSASAMTNRSYENIANNVLDVKRNQASNVLKQAHTALMNNDREYAKKLLTDALNRYKEIQRLYEAKH